MVVPRDRQNTFRRGLTDHIVVEHIADIHGCWHPVRGFFTDNIHAELNTLVADKHGRACDQLTHLMLAFAAEAAVEGVFVIIRFGRHGFPLGFRSIRP